MLISIGNQYFLGGSPWKKPEGFLLLVHRAHSWKPFFTGFSSIIIVILNQQAGCNGTMPGCLYAQGSLHN